MMSNFPDAHKVYDLAAVFRERVIEQGRSFLWPDQEIWTVVNARQLLAFESSLYDARSDMSIQDTANALGEHSQELIMMAADAQAACHLFWSSTSDTMQRHMNSFLEQQDLPSADQVTWTRLVEQAGAQVPASWTTYTYTSLSWHLSAVATLTTLCETRSEPRDVMSLETALLRMQRPGIWYHHVWCIAHVLYPDQIAALPAEDPRRRVINRYRSEAHVDTSAGEFSQLFKIREFLKTRTDGDHFDFYHPAIFLEWENRKDSVRLWAEYDRGGPIPNHVRKQAEKIIGVDGGSLKSGSVSHIVSDRAPVYEIARLFQERVIDQGHSLLWPDQAIWSNEVIDRFLTDFKINSASKNLSWLDLFRNQTSASDPRTVMLLADAYALIMQFASTDDYKGATKINALDTILQWANEPADVETLARVSTAFELGIGSPGIAFSAAISHQLAYVPLFVKCLRTISEGGVQAAADEATIAAKSEWDFKKTTVPARNIMLHLLEPESYERIASRSHKLQIVDSFSAQLNLGLDDTGDVDSALRTIRVALAGTYFASNFDYYDDEVKPYWQGDCILGPRGPKEPPPPPPIADLAKATFLDESHLRDIESLLASKKQLIFEGPPGSGKTFVAEKFARYFTAQPLTGERNNRIELVQFHQSYSYEDFVEGIRPETRNGQLEYNVKPGIFRNFAALALQDPDQNYVLIIDEINRGNVSRILGELMLLLEYRKESATLPYSQEKLEIPPNLYIIGTMNSADRSLSQIDYALRRRFYFVRFLPVENGQAPVLSGWLHQQDFDSATRSLILHRFIELNGRLRKHLETDDLQVGHSYFMHPSIGDEAFRKQVWKYAVTPLIREYLYHHRERDELLREYELQTLSSIVQPTADDMNEPVESVTGNSPAGAIE